ncbi:MAG: selenide, water dikinase SelD [Bacteroidales bacterium]|nr:selenide, water dikinase SelD [Bacteroidales bacterium]
MNTIYLDYNATTPVDKEVADEMRPFLDEFFGNPSSVHSYGIKTKQAVELARQRIASFLNCDTSEVIFTSGGTESNNYAIKGYAFAHKNKGNHIITSQIEHPAVIEVCKYLEKNGFTVSYIPVDEFGIVDINELRKSITPKTILISIMHANNEVGSIQPIEEIAKIAKENNIAFHSDAAQSAGKIAVDVKKMGVDLLSLAGHKLYAPKGIGALYIKSGIVLEKLIHGADHEQNMRAGTENVLEIVGLGKACEIAKKNSQSYAEHYNNTRNELSRLLKEAIPEMQVNGHPEKCLPNTLSVSFPNVEANTLVARLDKVAVSAGAACHAESVDVSTVLQAMNVPIEFAMGTIRLSTGRSNTLEQIKEAVQAISDTAKSLMPKNQKDSTQSKISAAKDIKLTHYTHGLGCACKIKPQNLEKILKNVAPFNHPDILVGTETSDDATVYRISDDVAIVQTLDFFTPIVDDPYDFGAIAAANALSDIYAMGAEPLFALNIVGFPEDTLPLEILDRILKGAHDKAAEAGIGALGGHTVEDTEPKYGMVVTGKIHPQKILRNGGAKPGDVLVLTKPIGTGIITTALKRGLVSDELRIEVTKQMAELNKKAAEVNTGFEIHACTDITGFGLLGHLREMSKASKHDVEIEFDKVPFIAEALNLATAGVIPGGTYNNLDFVKEDVNFGNLPRVKQLLLCDAQTSGGLLSAISRDKAEDYLEKLRGVGIKNAAIIGSVKENGYGKIYLV